MELVRILFELYNYVNIFQVSDPGATYLHIEGGPDNELYCFDIYKDGSHSEITWISLENDTTYNVYMTSEGTYYGTDGGSDESDQEDTYICLSVLTPGEIKKVSHIHNLHLLKDKIPNISGFNASYKMNWDFIGLCDVSDTNIFIYLIDDFIRIKLDNNGDHTIFDIYKTDKGNEICNFQCDEDFDEDKEHHFPKNGLPHLFKPDSDLYRYDRRATLNVHEVESLYWNYVHIYPYDEPFDKKKIVDLTLKHFERQVHTLKMLTFCDFDINFRM